MEALQDDLAKLWQEQRPLIEARIMEDTNPELAEAIRLAEADLAVVKAKEGALSERLNGPDAPATVRNDAQSAAGSGEKFASEASGPGAAILESLDPEPRSLR